MQKLRQRWGIKSNFQLVVIFIVFAVNGSAAARIGLYLMHSVGWHKNNTNLLLYYLVLTVLILPIYPILLMIVGWIFGQSEFFFPFAKKIFNRISFGLLFANKKPDQ